MDKQSRDLDEFRVVHSDDSEEPQESIHLDKVHSDDNEEPQESHQITISYTPLWKIYTDLIGKINMGELYRMVRDYKPSLWGAILGCTAGYYYGHDLISKRNFCYMETSSAMYIVTIPVAYATKGLVFGATYAISIPAATVYYGGKWLFNK